MTRTRDEALIVVVDDDPSQRQLFARWLQNAGHEVQVFADGESLMEGLSRILPDVICLDLNMPGIGGLRTLSHVRDHQPLIPVLMLTADTEVESVVAAMKAGAYDYLPKPIDKNRLLTQVRNALEKSRMSLQLAHLEREASGSGYPGIVGRSDAMTRVFRQLDRVAPSDITVLIHGESGTGKELVARAIHDRSAWRNGAFVALNCAAIPENLQESELFGHERGAFTGADSRREGRFEEANGGTMFLDEIGELSQAAQAKLLRVLQERSFRRVGGTKDIHTSFRLVAATHRDLPEDVRQGRFREDLFYRIAVFELEIPPLREREGDVRLLVDAFGREASEGDLLRVDTSAMEILERYGWPGNVRELRNTIQRAGVVASGGVIRPEDLPPRVVREAGLPASDQEEISPASERHEVRAAEPVSTDPGSLDELEKEAIREALARHRGNVSEVARRLGIGRTTLYRKLKKWNLV
jgi:DNA-binding NtrC family response regulator